MPECDQITYQIGFKRNAKGEPLFEVSGAGCLGTVDDVARRLADYQARDRIARLEAEFEEMRVAFRAHLEKSVRDNLI